MVIQKYRRKNWVLDKQVLVKSRKTGVSQGGLIEHTCILGYNSVYSKTYTSENQEIVFSFLGTTSK